MILVQRILCILLVITVAAATAGSKPRITSDEITLARVDVTSDPHKHLSVKLYGQSSEMSLMHTMLLFHSPNNLIGGREVNADLKRHKTKGGNASLLVFGHFHNAVIIGPHAYHLYQKITKDSQFEYNNEISISARGKDFSLPFSVAGSSEQWTKLTKQTTNSLSSLIGFTSNILLRISLPATNPMIQSPTYHAILSLGRYSSIWDRFNVIQFTRYTVSLLYREHARLTNTLGHYTGTVRIQCERTRHALDQRCIVDKAPGLWVSGTFYPSYNVVIDLHSSLNYLPTDLYFLHRAGAAAQGGTLRFNITAQKAGSHYNELPINNQFKFMLNEHSNDVIIGVDLLHYFPQVEYSIRSERIHLWYHSKIYTHEDSHENTLILFFIIIFVLFCCYIHWRTSTNYKLFKFITRYSHVGLRYIYFEHRQSVIEVVTILFAVPIIVAMFLFIDSTSSMQFQRTLLLLFMCLYGIVLIISAHVVSPDPFDKFLGLVKTQEQQQQQRQLGTASQLLGKDYFGTNKTVEKKNGDDEDSESDFEQVKEEFIESVGSGGGDRDRLIKLETYRVIVRSAALVELIWIEMLMMLNFSTLHNHLFFILFFIISLLYIYYNSYFMTLSILYCMVVSKQIPGRFTAFVVSQCLALLFFVAWALYCFYWDYFHSINTIYSDTEVVVFIGTLITTAILFGVYEVYRNIEEITRAHYT